MLRRNFLAGLLGISILPIDKILSGLGKYKTPTKTRTLKAVYTCETAQDLKCFHRIAAEQELINILQEEIQRDLQLS